MAVDLASLVDSEAGTLSPLIYCDEEVYELELERVLRSNFGFGKDQVVHTLSQLLSAAELSFDALAAILVASAAFSVWRIHPFEFTYFNSFVGGPEHGIEWLSDSNLDWGQDLKRVSDVLRRRGWADDTTIVVAVTARGPIAPVTAKSAAATEAIAAIAEAAAAALVALAVALDLAHHGRRAFLKLVDANGEIAQHVFVDALLALDLHDRGRRGIKVEQREMRLAVLVDAEVQRLHAPVFVLGDLATQTFDDGGELLGQVLDLLRADVLARQIDVFV